MLIGDLPRLCAWLQRCFRRSYRTSNTRIVIYGTAFEVRDSRVSILCGQYVTDLSHAQFWAVLGSRYLRTDREEKLHSTMSHEHTAPGKNPIQTQPSKLCLPKGTKRKSRTSRSKKAHDTAVLLRKAMMSTPEGHRQIILAWSFSYPLGLYSLQRRCRRSLNFRNPDCHFQTSWILGLL